MTEIVPPHVVQGVETQRGGWLGADGGPITQERGKAVLFTSMGDSVSSQKNVFQAESEQTGNSGNIGQHLDERCWPRQKPRLNLTAEPQMEPDFENRGAGEAGPRDGQVPAHFPKGRQDQPGFRPPCQCLCPRHRLSLLLAGPPAPQPQEGHLPSTQTCCPRYPAASSGLHPMTPADKEHLPPTPSEQDPGSDLQMALLREWLHFPTLIRDPETCSTIPDPLSSCLLPEKIQKAPSSLPFSSLVQPLSPAADGYAMAPTRPPPSLFPTQQPGGPHSTHCAFILHLHPYATGVSPQTHLLWLCPPA